MAGTKRDRQKAMREERRARELAAAKAAARRRRAIQVGAGVIVALAVVFLLSRGGGDDTTEVSTEGSSTTSPLDATASAAGKPCVPVSDPLPAGAPAVPVKVGPPPAQLVKEDLKVGTGATVGPKDTVTAHYVGVSCSTGKIFDSSYSRNQPVPFSLSGVIKGWTDGIPGMQVGGQRLLGIPAAQGYGAQGSPPDIAPDETLWFVVEIVETKAG
jgi:peptidylprolyl isomerase